MVKRGIGCCFSFLLILFFNSAFSQITDGHFKLVKSTWQVEKRLMIEDYMQFDDREASLFWPRYDVYMKKWGRLMDQRMNLAQEYCDDFYRLSETGTSVFIKKLFKNDIALTREQKNFHKKICKALSSSRAAEFMEVEYEFQLILLNEMQQRTPSVSNLLNPPKKL